MQRYRRTSLATVCGPKGQSMMIAMSKRFSAGSLQMAPLPIVSAAVTRSRGSCQTAAGGLECLSAGSSTATAIGVSRIRCAAKTSRPFLRPAQDARRLSERSGRSSGPRRRRPLPLRRNEACGGDGVCATRRVVAPPQKQALTSSPLLDIEWSTSSVAVGDVETVAPNKWAQSEDLCSEHHRELAEVRDGGGQQGFVCRSA